MTNIATNNGSDLIKDSDKQVILKLTKNNNVSTKDGEKDLQNVNTTEKAATENKSDSKLPYAGNKSIVIIILVVVAILICIIIFRKYKSIKTKK